MTDDLPPLRCVTCNKVLGNLWTDYIEMIEKGVSIEETLNNLGLKRPCCRMRLMNPIKVVDRQAQSQADVDRMFENNFDTLSVAVDPQAVTTGALSIMTNTTDIIIQEETDIELPPLPVLPPIQETEKITRIYKHW